MSKVADSIRRGLHEAVQADAQALSARWAIVFSIQVAS